MKLKLIFLCTMMAFSGSASSMQEDGVEIQTPVDFESEWEEMLSNHEAETNHPMSFILPTVVGQSKMAKQQKRMAQFDANFQAQ